jgi:ribosomal-protein-alanine N-acetyltransferase
MTPGLPTRIEAVRGVGQAAALAAVHAGAFARPWGEGEFTALLRKPTTRTHALLSGPDLAGFAMSQLVIDEAEVLTVAVAPRMRGRGHAGPLLARHLGDLAAEGARVVHLEVEVGNAPALALYVRAGFREVGRRPGYYAKAGDTSAEAVRMTLEFLEGLSAAASTSPDSGCGAPGPGF